MPDEAAQTGEQDYLVTARSMPLDPSSWQRACPDLPYPLQQHPVYGLALQSMGGTAEQLELIAGEEVVATALIMRRRLFGVIRFSTLFRGPVWHQRDVSQKLRGACHKFLKAQASPWRWDFLVQMPELAAGERTDDLMCDIGLRQVMTGFSTAWIDLREPEETLRANLKGKWRNQLVKAEKSPFEISTGGKKPHQYSWLLEKEAEQRSSRRYQATPIGLVPAFVAASTPKSGTSVLAVSAIHQKRRIAGALFLLHGNSATYHIGWAGEEARNLNAQNRVLWEGMKALKKQGISFLDLGGLNTADLAGIARFKLGTGAEPLVLAGSFI